MAWNVIPTHAFRRDCRKLVPEIRRKLEEAIQGLAGSEDPRKLVHGERLSPSSPLARDLFNITCERQNWEGVGSKPKPLRHSGVKHLVERALWRSGLRVEKKRRHEFATDLGFRKFFKTRAEQVMKPINVEWLMGHSTGISNSYYRPTENDLLADYLKVVPLLTVSEVEEVPFVDFTRFLRSHNERV